MFELLKITIDDSCNLARNCFPSMFLLKILKEITADDNLDNFPETRASEMNIIKSKKRGSKLSSKAIDEISNYFYENKNNFLNFLKLLCSQSIEQNINKFFLDEFISKVNALLLEDANIKIEDSIIIKLVPNKAKKDIFLNINVPDYIEDYFLEALNCLAHELFRSSILFCIFAFEASLRYRFFKSHGTMKFKPKKGKKRNIYFQELIEWAINKSMIEVLYPAEEENLKFIRTYRNDLVHCDLSKPKIKRKISTDYAKKMCNIVIYLVKRFINEIFFYD